MEPLNKTAIKSALMEIIWDYDCDPDELFEVISGKRTKAGPFDLKRLFVRMLERLSWYELIELLGMDYIREHLTEEVVGKIRFKTLRGRYETVRNVLSGNFVSFPGWNSEYSKKIKHTLLSNRWYRTQ